MPILTGKIHDPEDEYMDVPVTCPHDRLLYCWMQGLVDRLIQHVGVSKKFWEPRAFISKKGEGT